MRSRFQVPMVGSFVVHAALVAAAMVVTARLARERVTAPVAPGLDVDFVPPPPAPAPVAPAVAVQTPQPTAVSHPPVHQDNPPRAVHRVMPVEQPTTLLVQDTAQNTNDTIRIAPPVVAQPTTPTLTAASLFTHTDSTANAAARAGEVDLGRPNGGYRPSRDLFNAPHVNAYDPEHMRQVAAGPTMQLLDESHHMQPAGAGVHDSRVARLAGEVFSPVRTIANLGTAVMRSPLVGSPPVAHQAQGAEVAATEALDQAHASSFTMMQMANVPPPPMHLVRAEIDVFQDQTGAVRDTRVIHQSGVPGFDDAAMAALRESMPEVTEVELHEGRQSRWAFEVSDAVGILGTLAGSGNEGWRVISEQSNGVRLRYRVRMVRARPWQGS